MKQRQIGTNGPWVSEIGLGCMGMSQFYGPRDDDASAQTLLRALDLGVNHFDSAYFYGAGHNEELIGRVLGGRRDEVFLATKFAHRVGANGERIIDSSGAWAKQSCDDALRRLGFDHIDLFYLHRRNPATPIEETMQAMASLVEAGKVRWVGLSEVNANTLRAAHAVHPVSALQMEYSLFSRDIEQDGILETCRELGIALVAYSPVSRGLLTGRIQSMDGLSEDDFRRQMPRFGGSNFARNAALVAALTEVAAQLGCTPAQAAIAWVLSRGDDVLPIPGTKRVSYLEENAAAADVVLSPRQWETLQQAVPATEVAGERYSAMAKLTTGH